MQSPCRQKHSGETTILFRVSSSPSARLCNTLADAQLLFAYKIDRWNFTLSTLEVRRAEIASKHGGKSFHHQQ